MRTKTYNCVADLHLFSSYEMELDEAVWASENLILLADIIEKKNALKKNKNLTQFHIDYLKSLGVPYVSSNHEGEQGLPDFYKDEETKVLFTHGHLVKANAEKYIKDAHTNWEGCSLFKYLLKGTYNRLPRLVPFSSDDARRASELAKSFGCTTIIL
ncbi:MAG: hypothetical protein ACKOW2_08700, partial [Sphingobacteriaceae bacterium]